MKILIAFIVLLHFSFIHGSSLKVSKDFLESEGVESEFEVFETLEPGVLLGFLHKLSSKTPFVDGDITGFPYILETNLDFSALKYNHIGFHPAHAPPLFI